MGPGLLQQVSSLLVLLNWGDWLLLESPPPAFTLGFFASVCPFIQGTLVSTPVLPSSHCSPFLLQRGDGG